MNDQTIAKTILSQIGGQFAMQMIGAKRLTSTPNGLIIRFANVTNNKCNQVTVTLDPSDTYTMDFARVWGKKTTLIRSVSDVYCDTLMDIFESNTDMLLSLYARG